MEDPKCHRQSSKNRSSQLLSVIYQYSSFKRFTSVIGTSVGCQTCVVLKKKMCCVILFGQE
ncbi:hypothetical protein EJB05_18348 [Eragrostis curvula]|uniref:Uncharacterized protein n=1 Tax=Eragrostis curvula TaxID=38414 RepID=A0A5J9VLL2_9POAL|nr:hypothetical protein EJB05_18348 [Eragrostis curvula]